jgi:hypothetical protein
MSKIWFPGEDKLHQASTQEEMGSWNSGFKKIADRCQPLLEICVEIGGISLS